MLKTENEMPVTTQCMAKAFGPVSLQIASKPIRGRVDRAVETQLRMQEAERSPCSNRRKIKIICNA